MADWFEIFTVPLNENLYPLDVTLERDGVMHRIVENAGQQVLLLHNTQDIPLVKQRIQEWQQGRLPSEVVDLNVKPAPRRSMLHTLVEMPIVWLLALLSIVGFFIVELDFPRLLSTLIFQAVDLTRGHFYVQPEVGFVVDGQWWKIITPMFLHFGIFHLIFNLFWLFEFGNKVERFQSSGRLLLVVLFTAIIANVCQFTYQPADMFGGLSGAVYGLFAYCMLHSRLYRVASIKHRYGVETFLIIWLLIGMTNILSVMQIANIANAAHLGGLFAGLLIALVPPSKKITL